MLLLLLLLSLISLLQGARRRRRVVRVLVGSHAVRPEEAKAHVTSAGRSPEGCSPVGSDPAEQLNLLPFSR